MSTNDSNEQTQDPQDSPACKSLLPPVKWPKKDEFILASEALSPLIHLMAELFGVKNIPTSIRLQITAIRIAGEETLGSRKLTPEETVFYHQLVSNMHNGCDAMYTLLMAAFQMGNEWRDRNIEEGKTSNV